MEEHVRAYARLRLEMAREELDTARENIRQQEEADYAEDVIVDEAIARQTLADAERFTDRLERFLKDVNALQG